MKELTRRKLMQTSVAAALGASVAGAGVASADVEETDTPGAPGVRGELKRFSTTSFGCEMTGPFVFEDGSLLFSHQHPSRDNPTPFDLGGVGYVSGFSFRQAGNNDDFAELSVPDTDEKQRRVRVGNGEYVFLVQERDEINGGTERWGVAQTPDGTDVTQENFAGTTYGTSGTNPDCNEFVATDDEGTEGFLFTNFENSPGVIARLPISQTDDGEWEADLDEAINVVNTEPFREIGGTRINCYGDLSPWGTMISSEEHYAHPRVSLTATVSDMLEAGTGKGLRGAADFWNRPNPTEIQDVIGEYYEEDWYIQGYWNMDGVEHLAYHLGADPVDQANGGDTNTTTPIGERYPNPYRYGYHVDIREPAGDPPQPVKYYVMGRASWEAPDIQSDQRTVYGCSDGDSKGIYKFVADQPIPSYDDPMDIAGTLYAPKITNESAMERNSPADVDLEIKWLDLGHATNREIASWIAEYDDINQETYLETHAETDWTEDLATALEEADRAVVENGNQELITNEEIVEWARQYEQRGPNNVDESLRRVPFLETRAAGKEIGATIEFNKAEGVDSVDGAGPGDFVYFGISEFNDDMANDQGDLQMDRVDGGAVYRGELERDFNVSTLEPVIVGPDFSDPPEDADGALRNVDNVYVMDDGRVLCCEDGFGGPARSYPNDGMYVYQPPVSLDIDSIAVGNGKTGTAYLRMSGAPDGLAGGRLTVSITEPAVATFADVEIADAIGLADASIADDGTTATLKFTDLDRNVQSGALDVVLASLAIRGTNTGTTDVEIRIDRVDDEDGNAIDAEARTGLVVTGPPALPGSEAAPTDPDDDGHYEDLNGNGRLDYDDVVLLFDQFESDAVQLNDAAYDFNDNGELDFDDIVSVYEEV